VRSLPGSPDLANKTRRWAIFVNGCFWHNHTGCKLATIPTRNAAFWGQKFAANRKRDAAKIRQLRRAGFKTIVVWQCQTRDRRALEARLAALAPSLDGRDKS
jgi:DNA mismatch endonuclease (patch repair protein)